MIVTFWLLYLIGVVFLVLHFKNMWVKRKQYWLSWKIPGPTAYPLVGNGLLFLCKQEEILKRTYEACTKYPGPYVRFWIGTKLIIGIKDAEDAEKILTSVKFINKDSIYKFMKEFNGEGLITGSGSKWKRDRKLMSPFFQKKVITAYLPFVLNHSKKLVDILQEKVGQSTFNAEKYLQRCATDFVNESIMGIKSNAQSGQLDDFLETISRMYVIAHSRIVKFWLQKDWIFRLTHKYEEQEAGKAVVHGYMMDALHYLEQNPTVESGDETEPISIFERMVLLRRNVPNFATDMEMVHHLCTLFTASEDTISTISSFACLLLGMYPEIQQKAVNELFQVLGDPKRELEIDDIPSLQYIEMISKEVLRLYPIAPFIMRTASEDFSFGEYTIPKGCSVMVVIQSLHRDARYWEKPNEFHPDHFLPEAVEKRHPFAYLPFSAGFRGCLGKPYARMAIVSLLAIILQKYEIEADGSVHDIKIKSDISVREWNQYYPIRIKNRTVI